jgi:hypothetical protein
MEGYNSVKMWLGIIGVCTVFSVTSYPAIYSLRGKLKCKGERRMGKEQLPTNRQVNCDHLSHFKINALEY